jgi:hypothetical protein
MTPDRLNYAPPRDRLRKPWRDRWWFAVAVTLGIIVLASMVCIWVLGKLFGYLGGPIHPAG